MRRSVEDATRKRARRSTGCTTARHGDKSETRSQKVWRIWKRGQELRGKTLMFEGPAGREKYASQATQDGLLEEMGGKTRV